MRNSFHAGLFAPFLALWATAAQAQGYFGLGLGQSKFWDQPPTSCAEFGLPPSCTLSKRKDTDSAYRVFGGFQASPSFAVEAGYVNLGKSHVDIGSPVAASADFAASGIDISGIGFIPFGANFGGMARVGLFSWTAKPSVTTPGGTGKGNDTGISLTFGLGLTYEFSKRFDGRFEWQRYFKVGSSDSTGTTDIDLFSINGVFRF